MATPPVTLPTRQTTAADDRAHRGQPTALTPRSAPVEPKEPGMWRQRGRTDSVVLSQRAVPPDKSDGSMATDPAPARNARTALGRPASPAVQIALVLHEPEGRRVAWRTRRSASRLCHGRRTRERPGGRADPTQAVAAPSPIAVAGSVSEPICALDLSRHPVGRLSRIGRSAFRRCPRPLGVWAGLFISGDGDVAHGAQHHLRVAALGPPVTAGSESG